MNHVHKARPPACTRCITVSGTPPVALCSTASASAYVEVSGTVGPDAMLSRGSPITSERTHDTTCAGYAAAASWPPLHADMCLRTVLSSWMVAPHRCSACVVVVQHVILVFVFVDFVVVVIEEEEEVVVVVCMYVCMYVFPLTHVRARYAQEIIV